MSVTVPPEIMHLLSQLKREMRALSSEFKADFNDLDIQISEDTGTPEVVGFVVSVHYEGYEYGAYIALSKAQSLPLPTVAAYLYGYGIGRYYESEIDPQLKKLLESDDAEKSATEFRRYWSKR